MSRLHIHGPVECSKWPWHDPRLSLVYVCLHFLFKKQSTNMPAEVVTAALPQPTVKNCTLPNIASDHLLNLQARLSHEGKTCLLTGCFPPSPHDNWVIFFNFGRSSWQLSSVAPPTQLYRHLLINKLGHQGIILNTTIFLLYLIMNITKLDVLSVGWIRKMMQ